MIETKEECKTAGMALEVELKPQPSGGFNKYVSDGVGIPPRCIYITGKKKFAFNSNLNSGISRFVSSGANSRFVPIPESGEPGLKYIYKIPAAATRWKNLDTAHHIFLNTHLNELDATYETTLVDYKTKKGKDFVVGPVTQWKTAYANADADQSLADEDFRRSPAWASRLLLTFFSLPLYGPS
jgi:hypothetical protein